MSRTFPVELQEWAESTRVGAPGGVTSIADDSGHADQGGGPPGGATAATTDGGGPGTGGAPGGGAPGGEAPGGAQAGEAAGLREAVGKGSLVGRRPIGDPAEALLPTDVTDEDLHEVYVRPEEHARARQALAEHRLVVLRGRTGSGRNAMARHLLLHELGVEQLDKLRPDTEPAQVRPRKDAGQLLERWSPEQAGRLDDLHVGEWRDALDGCHGYLVVTVDEEVSPPASVPLVECASLPDLQLVLQQHLAYFLRTREGLRLRKEDLEWLGGDRIRRRLHRRRELRSTVRLARRLARPLAAAPTPDHFRDLEQWLEEDDDDAPQEMAKQLLQRSPDVDHWSFVISLAVFDGRPYQLVADAAGLLARRLAPGDPRHAAAWQPGPARAERLEQAGGQQAAPDGGRPLAWRLAPGDPRHATPWRSTTARAARIKEAEAELFDAREQPAPFIRTPVARARFKDPELPHALLDLVWNELDGLRGPVRDWLDALGGDGEVEVREPTAVAVGYLASHGFGYVLDLIIEPWAWRDGTREAAGLALGALARNDRFNPQVLALLSRWARAADRPLRETAALAHGCSIGRRQPDVALRELRSLARRGDAGELPVVARALYELVRRRQDRHVLEALAAWTTAPERTTWEPAERRLLWTGLAAFLMIAHLYEEGRPRREGLWPLLLVQAEDNPVAREQIVVLWRRALADDFLAEAAADTLCGWTYQADLQSTPAGVEQPGVRTALRRLLADVAGGGPGDLGRVRQAVRRCAQAHDDPSEIARKLAAELA
jgi:hypothetical protein